MDRSSIFLHDRGLRSAVFHPDIIHMNGYSITDYAPRKEGRMITMGYTMMYSYLLSRRFILNARSNIDRISSRGTLRSDTLATTKKTRVRI